MNETASTLRHRFLAMLQHEEKTKQQRNAKQTPNDAWPPSCRCRNTLLLFTSNDTCSQSYFNVWNSCSSPIISFKLKIICRGDIGIFGVESERFRVVTTAAALPRLKGESKVAGDKSSNCRPIRDAPLRDVIVKRHRPISGLHRVAF